MGDIMHNTIVVTSWSDDALQKALDAVPTEFIERGLVSPIVGPGINGQVSFFIAPDGSKEGWKDSDDCDAARAEYKMWLRETRNQSIWLDWFECRFGGDDPVAEIIDHGQKEFEEKE